MFSHLLLNLPYATKHCFLMTTAYCSHKTTVTCIVIVSSQNKSAKRFSISFYGRWSSKVSFWGLTNSNRPLEKIRTSVIVDSYNWALFGDQSKRAEIQKRILFGFFCSYIIAYRAINVWEKGLWYNIFGIITSFHFLHIVLFCHKQSQSFQNRLTLKIFVNLWTKMHENQWKEHKNGHSDHAVSSKGIHGMEKITKLNYKIHVAKHTLRFSAT